MTGIIIAGHTFMPRVIVERSDMILLDPAIKLHFLVINACCYTLSPGGRAEGPAALTVVLRSMPVHEEKRKQTTSFLQEHESKTRSRIAEFGRLAAELRYKTPQKSKSRLSIRMRL